MSRQYTLEVMIRTATGVEIGHYTAPDITELEQQLMLIRLSNNYTEYVVRDPDNQIVQSDASHARPGRTPCQSWLADNWEYDRDKYQ